LSRRKEEVAGKGASLIRDSGRGGFEVNYGLYMKSLRKEVQGYY
jgi:hypothetical protein